MKIRHYHVRVLWQQFVLKADNANALCIICVIEFIQQCLQIALHIPFSGVLASRGYGVQRRFLRILHLERQCMLLWGNRARSRLTGKARVSVPVMRSHFLEANSRNLPAWKKPQAVCVTLMRLR